MHTLSVPISMLTLTKENRHVYLDRVRQCGAKRVFLCCMDPIFAGSSLLYTNPELLQDTICYFQWSGLEVGIWMSCFGQGVPLAGMDTSSKFDDFTLLTGIDGKTATDAFCPLDQQFSNVFRDAVLRIAQMKPDLIMLDDDFRLSSYGFYMGCFCPLHQKEYYKRIGEDIPLDLLEQKIFSGGKNKYRTAYMQMLRDTLLDFAHMLRAAVDTVAPQVRLGACMINENWDFDGTDPIEIAKAFAGNTRPFLRTIGAPYWPKSLSSIIEDTRLQLHWCNGQQVEAFAEGDVYPRPRYAVGAARLELFDLILTANGQGDGILKYMFDYTFRPDYEEGYITHHIHNAPLRQAVQELFAGKSAVGVRAFNALHKIENWQLPDTPSEDIGRKLVYTNQSTAGYILAGNSIPSAYTDQSWPILVFGENARYVTEDDLKNGAFLDIPAAMILRERGIDTGLTAQEDMALSPEYFEAQQDTARAYGTAAVKKISCAATAKVLSRFTTTDTPACYTYENAEGLRFSVLSCDWYRCFAYTGDANPHFFCNYYRQAQLISVFQWLGDKNLPAVCVKNPNLYLLAAKGEQAMSVALANIFEDAVLNPVIQLDKAYKHIRFVNCSGTLDGDTVRLNTLPPYGFAAFEVS